LQSTQYNKATSVAVLLLDTREASEVKTNHISLLLHVLTCKLFPQENWSLTLREECTLRVLRIFGSKRDEVTGVEKIS
jgi:hypothetical protein